MDLMDLHARDLERADLMDLHARDLERAGRLVASLREATRWGEGIVAQQRNTRLGTLMRRQRDVDAEVTQTPGRADAGDAPPLVTFLVAFKGGGGSPPKAAAFDERWIQLVVEGARLLLRWKGRSSKQDRET
jgi:hypothetical protein